jgi:hypothetical protein
MIVLQIRVHGLDLLHGEKSPVLELFFAAKTTGKYGKNYGKLWETMGNYEFILILMLSDQ